MNTHNIQLNKYLAKSTSGPLRLGTAGSHGNEHLQVTPGEGWEGLIIQVIFHPCQVAVQLPADGLLEVPWEATAEPLTALQGRIVFQGFDADHLVNSTDLTYTVAGHSSTTGRDEQPYTPGIVEGVLNQMAADKDDILQAAQQAAASENAAGLSAASAQSAAGQAAAGASQAAAQASAAQQSAQAAQNAQAQAAGSAAAASEMLTQVQTAGQQAQQKVQDAETAALDKIAAVTPSLPAVSADAARQSVTVNPDGSGYTLAAMAPLEASIRPTVSGNPAVCEDSVAWSFQGLRIYGKSTQDGTPSPENPVPIVSAGEGGTVSVTVCGENIIPISSESKTINGVTFTVLDDGTVEITGTPEDTFADFYVYGQNADTGEYVYIPKGCSVSFEYAGSEVTKAYIFPIFRDKDAGALIGIKLINEALKETDLYIYGAFIRAVKMDSFVSGGIAKLWSNFPGRSGYYPFYNLQQLTLSAPSGLPGRLVTSGGNYTDGSGQQWISNVVDLESKKRTEYNAIFSSEGKNAGFIFGGDWWNLQIDGKYGYLQNPVLGGGVATDFCNAVPADVFKVNGDQGFVYVSAEKGQSIFGTIENANQWIKANTLIIQYRTTPKDVILEDDEVAAYRALVTYPGTTVVSTAEPVAGIEARYIMDGTAAYTKITGALAQLSAANTQTSQTADTSLGA